MFGFFLLDLSDGEYFGIDPPVLLFTLDEFIFELWRKCVLFVSYALDGKVAAVEGVCGGGRIEDESSVEVVLQWFLFPVVTRVEPLGYGLMEVLVPHW